MPLPVRLARGVEKNALVLEPDRHFVLRHEAAAHRLDEERAADPAQLAAAARRRLARRRAAPLRRAFGKLEQAAIVAQVRAGFVGPQPEVAPAQLERVDA